MVGNEICFTLGELFLSLWIDQGHYSKGIHGKINLSGIPSVNAISTLPTTIR